MRSTLFVWICLVSITLTLRAQPIVEAVAFGLKHTVITNAEFSPPLEDVLTVSNTAFSICGGTTEGTNCPESGPFAVSVHLEGSDAGIFIWPNAEETDGASLEGTVYGTVDGVTNTLIGTARGTREAWGEYDVQVDFSPIGATSYTYQVYYRDFLSLEITNQAAEAHIRTSNYDPGLPRVNPARLLNGRVAVIVEFQGTSEIDVPGYYTYATRVVITAESAETVESVSRLDVTGSANLAWFSFNNERLGKFGLFHQALGGVHFGVAPTQLTLSNLLSPAGNGMFTELPRVQRYQAALMPYAITNEELAWTFSASGVSSLTRQVDHFGEVRVSRDGGDLELTAAFETNHALVRVFNAGTLVGAMTTSNGYFGTIGGSNWVMHSYGAAATQTDEPAYIGFRLADSATLSNASGATLIGDEFRVSPAVPNGTLGVLTSFALMGENLDEVTFTGMETFTPPPVPLRLEIVRDGNEVRLAWPYTPDFYLHFKSSLTNPDWSYVSSGQYTNFNFESRYSTPPTNPASFFVLRHFFGEYLVRTNTF